MTSRDLVFPNNEETLASVVNSIAEGVVVADKSGRFRYFNPVAQEILGFGSMAADPADWSELYGCYRPDERTPYLSEDLPLARALVGEEVSDEVVFIRNPMRPEGLFINVTAGPIWGADGSAEGGTAIFRDITDQVRHSEQDSEVRIAQALQQRYYSSAFVVPGYDITGAVFPVTDTCGDYYDVFGMCDGFVGLVVADVTGHGIGSALVVAETRALLRAFAKTESDPCVLMDLLNRDLYRDLDDHHFVTMVLVRLDPRHHELKYSSAGHVSGYVLDRFGDVKRTMESTGIPLGVMEDYEYCQCGTMEIAFMDMVVLISDGIEEARSRDRTEFGVDGMLETIKLQRRATSSEIISDLYRSVREFAAPLKQQDDITSVICKGHVAARKQ